jgi:hypothetical protein
MPDLRAGAGVVGRRHRLVPVFGRRSGPGGSLDAYLGLHAPGGDHVGQCRVVAFVLVGVGLAEVGHGLADAPLRDWLRWRLTLPNRTVSQIKAGRH